MRSSVYTESRRIYIFSVSRLRCIPSTRLRWFLGVNILGYLSVHSSLESFPTFLFVISINSVDHICHSREWFSRFPRDYVMPLARGISSSEQRSEWQEIYCDRYHYRLATKDNCNLFLGQISRRVPKERINDGESGNEEGAPGGDPSLSSRR